MGKKKPARRNRYKKRNTRKLRSIWGPLALGLKLVSLMALVLAFSTLFVLGYATVTQTSYLRTRTIDIKGNLRLTEMVILNQAGIRKGDNLLAVNLKVVRTRLLAHPWIASATVAREIPQTIKINLTEHQPLAIVDLGKKYLINHRGRIFKKNEAADPQLPLVTGLAYVDISLGSDRLTPVMKTVVQLLQLSRERKSVIPYAEIRKFHVDSQMGVTLSVWEDERRIKLGNSRFAYKYDRLKKLLPHLKYNHHWKQFQAIDVNNPDRIVVQL